MVAPPRVKVPALGSFMLPLPVTDPSNSLLVVLAIVRLLPVPRIIALPTGPVNDGIVWFTASISNTADAEVSEIGLVLGRMLVVATEAILDVYKP